MHLQRLFPQSKCAGRDLDGVVGGEDASKDLALLEMSTMAGLSNSPAGIAPLLDEGEKELLKCLTPQSHHRKLGVGYFAVESDSCERRWSPICIGW